MWPLKRTTRRRTDARKPAGGELSLWRRFWNAGGAGAVLLALLFYAGVAVLDLWPVDPLPYRVDQYVPQNIYSRVSFQVELPNELAEQQRIINRDTPATFVPDDAAIDQAVARLKTAAGQIQAATQPKDVESLTKPFGLTEADIPLEAWHQALAPNRQKEFEDKLARLRDELLDTPIVASEDAETQRGRGTRYFRLIGAGGKAKIENIEELVGLREMQKIDAIALGLATHFDPALRPGVSRLLAASLKAQATHNYDDALTQQEKDRRFAEFRGSQQGQKRYEPGDVLVLGSRYGIGPKDEVRPLTGADLELLAAEHDNYLRLERADHSWLYAGRVAGRLGVLALVTLLLCVYVVRLRKDLVKDHLQAAILAETLLVLLAAVKVMTYWLGWHPQTAMLPVLLAAVVVVIAFDHRFAWAVGTVLAVFTVLQLRGDMWLFLLLLIAVTATIFQLREVRSRTKLILVSLTTAVVAFIAQCAAELAATTPIHVIVRDSAWAGGSALLVGFLAQGLLPLIERMFGIATSMTLLEWADANKPLQRRLFYEAPGTYNHSIQLGVLCEAAAEAIGARGLLARVGALYHDIGKINKPEYFVENQAGSASKHAKLSPAMSLLIITGHVKDGLELAREYGLPRVLQEFIISHHGTTLVQYFYQAATEQRRTDADRAPDEVEFRYGGPKPSSKEAAILMLADAAESSVRSMSEATPGRIENQVHTMVMRRLMDGQLDECDLTLREVRLIELSLVKSLTSMYHLRVAYPTPAGQKPSAAELQAGRRAEGEKAADKNGNGEDQDEVDAATEHP